jgi:hypothetical protein
MPRYAASGDRPDEAAMQQAYAGVRRKGG